MSRVDETTFADISYNANSPVDIGLRRPSLRSEQPSHLIHICMQMRTQQLSSSRSEIHHRPARGAAQLPQSIGIQHSLSHLPTRD